MQVEIGLEAADCSRTHRVVRWNGEKIWRINEIPDFGTDVSQIVGRVGALGGPPDFAVHGGPPKASTRPTGRCLRGLTALGRKKTSLLQTFARHAQSGLHFNGLATIPKGKDRGLSNFRERWHVFLHIFHILAFHEIEDDDLKCLPPLKIGRFHFIEERQFIA